MYCYSFFTFLYEDCLLNMCFESLHDITCPCLAWHAMGNVDYVWSPVHVDSPLQQNFVFLMTNRWMHPQSLAARGLTMFYPVPFRRRGMGEGEKGRWDRMMISACRKEERRNWYLWPALIWSAPLGSCNGPHDPNLHGYITLSAGKMTSPSRRGQEFIWEEMSCWP